MYMRSDSTTTSPSRVGVTVVVVTVVCDGVWYDYLHKVPYIPFRSCGQAAPTLEQVHNSHTHNNTHHDSLSPNTKRCGHSELSPTSYTSHDPSTIQDAERVFRISRTPSFRILCPLSSVAAATRSPARLAAAQRRRVSGASFIRAWTESSIMMAALPRCTAMPMWACSSALHSAWESRQSAGSGSHRWT